jgi:phosphoenolpyruvate synthase/pyruvate phosphate dikinase
VSKKVWVVDDEPSPDYPVWTRANVGEVFPDIVTPMGWTIEPGDVLVAVTTDSSWGPLFLTAGAVVVDTGAAVSHAVIVSR